MLKSEGHILLACVVSFSALLSCQKPEVVDNGNAIKTLVVPVYQPIPQLNPLLVTTTLSSRISEFIFDGLIRLDDKLEVQPRIAGSWALSPDQLTWSFYLRKGILFHDGIEMTAADVKFSIDWFKKPTTGGKLSFSLHEVERVAIEDKYTVAIHLKKPMVSFLSNLSDMAILPEHLLGSANPEDTDFKLRPIGTGPFKVRNGLGTETVLEANEQYFLGRPRLDQIIVKVYPNQESAWAGLMSGNVDFFQHIAPETFQLSRQIPMVHFYSVLEPYYYVMAFNIKKLFFQDRRVRQALNYAINKEEIIAKVLKGYGRAMASTIYPGSWAYNTEMKPYSYDPKKALALLKKAGWQDHDGDHFLDKNGRRFEFTVYANRGDDLKQQVLLLVQQQLLDLGIKMEVKLFDAADTDFLFQKQFDAHFPEIEAVGDPDLSYKYWHSSQIHGGFNVGSYRNTEVDRLIEEGRHTFDRPKRKAIYDKFQQALLDDPPGVFLFWTDYLVGVNERFKGVKISPVGPFANIREWYVDEGQQSKP
jgi:peptide/nickel transport system substrate-binding protein